MEPRKHRLALVAALALGGGCGGGASGIALAPAWTSAGVPVRDDVFGHNTVWAEDGLGLWDPSAHAIDARARQPLAETAPKLLRFPGGTRAMRYHFAQELGAQRTPQCDPFRGVVDDTTYGPDEFFGVAGELGAGVTWVAPWVDGSPDETAAIAQYLAAHGNAKYLEVGNEPYLGLPAGPTSGSCGRASQFVQDERWVGDMRIPTTAADYAAQLAATAPQVRAANPALLIGAPATSQYDGASDAMDAVGDVDASGSHDAWNRRLLSDAHDAFDFFVLHPYDFSVDDEARVHLADRARKTVRDLRAAAPDKQVAITEYGFLFNGNSLLAALVTADMTRMAIEEQLLMLVRHILIEVETGPFADSAQIGPGYATTPAHAAIVLLDELQGATAFPTPELVADGSLVALPARRADGSLRVLFVDKRTDDGAARAVRVTLPPGDWDTTVATLTAATVGDRDAATTTTPATAASGSVNVQVPAHAVVVLAATAR